jgi:aspartate 1-decarboxylase
VNGAAARLVQIGDRLIVVSHALRDEADLAGHSPMIVVLDSASAVSHVTSEVPSA